MDIYKIVFRFDGVSGAVYSDSKETAYDVYYSLAAGKEGDDIVMIFQDYIGTLPPLALILKIQSNPNRLYITEK